jgi:Pentapeptide repeats (8 copies)
MLVRRTGRKKQVKPRWLRAPRRAKHWYSRPAGAPPRDLIQIFVTSLPGLAAVAALILTFLSIRATGTQLQITEQGQLTDRYNAAIINLGSPDVDVRFGAIYALQRIMNDSPADQPAVVAVLSAYVRDRANRATKTPHLLTSDIQAALTVVVHRDIANDGSVDFTKTDLYHASLRHAQLQGAFFTSADLTLVDLKRANLQGAHLQGAVLTGAYLFQADFSGADLSGADLTGANLTGANLCGANLTGVKGLHAGTPRCTAGSTPVR